MLHKLRLDLDLDLDSVDQIMFSVFLLLTAVCIILTLATFSWLPLRLWLKRRRRVQELARLLPGPKTLPLLGNANLFVGLEPAQVCQVIADLAAQHGDTYTIWLGSNFSVMMFDPRDVEVVLGSTQLLDKAMEYGFLMRWLNEGLLVSRGRKWHKRRKIITPAFHFRILEQYVEIFDRQTRQLIQHLQLALGVHGKNPIDLGHAAHLCTLDVICGESRQVILLITF
ncbi:hypothetical protein ACLKA7_005788 [Drosophila subpalustris]